MSPALAFITIVTLLYVIQQIASVRRLTAIRGSHVRYVAASWDIATCLALALTWTTWSIIMLVGGEIIAAVVGAVAAGLWLWIAKRIYDEDNWFKDQQEKLKRKLKKLREDLSAAHASPSPA